MRSFLFVVSLTLGGYLAACSSDAPLTQPDDELPLVEPAGGNAGATGTDPGGGGAGSGGAGAKAGSSSLLGGAAGSLAGPGGGGGSSPAGSAAQAGSQQGGQAGAGPQGGSAQAGQSGGSGLSGGGQSGSGDAGSAQAGSGNGPQAGSGQAGSAQAGSAQAGSGQAGSGQAGSGQAGVGQAGSGQAGSGQAGSGQAGSGQAGAMGCPAGETLCGADCRVLANDPTNCGSCGHVCPGLPNGQPVCINAACSVACSPGTTFCADGCHSLPDDVNNCGACGHACPGVANGQAQCGGGSCSTSCSAGYQPLGGQCAVFGGFYSLDTTGDCGGCTTPNPLTNDCSCPAGFVPTQLQAWSNCYSSQLVVCGPQGTPVGDYAGAFQQVFNGDGTTCAPNPFTGDCTCPADATPVALQTLIGVFDLCVRTGAPISSFGGVFQLDNYCRVPNPRTADCTCPPGTSPRIFPTILYENDSSVPSQISICMP